MRPSNLAVRNAWDAAAAVVHAGLAPEHRLTVSEWADAHRILSREASAEPGPWRTDRAPYQRGIMDAFSDPVIETVVIMSASQIGKTEIVNNIVGYYIDQDPAPMLVVQPNVDPMAKSWSLDRLAPMLRDCPRLRGKVADPKTRDSGNTVLHKVFPGGHITVVGANSPAGLGARPIRVVLLDEVDRYPDTAGTEGDPVTLATQRTATFWNRKILLTSTPTLRGFSRIEEAWLESDQRHYHVPCPPCGAKQPLVWSGLRWREGAPESAAYACQACAALIDEREKMGMLERGEWVATNPGSRIAGFHVNALYSPWRRWAELARDWIPAQRDPTRLQAFVNLQLGESWEERGGGHDPEALERRQEAYPTDAQGLLVPAGVGALTAGVDVQDDRIEVLTIGWGQGEESWRVARDFVLGDPGKVEPWKQLDALLARRWRREGGGELGIRLAGVDSGHHTEMVYRFCGPRYPRVVALKGSSEPARPLVNRRPSVNNRYGIRLFFVGTDTAKDLLYARLRIATPGPGCMHFPIGLEPDYYRQLTAEKVVKRQVAGRWVRRYELPRGERNEALDCEVYALVAFVLANVPARELVRGTPPPAPAPPPPEGFAQQRLSQRLRPRRPRGWIDGWRG
jgi:phage terminase large subunit GpA-like protein